MSQPSKEGAHRLLEHLRIAPIDGVVGIGTGYIVMLWANQPQPDLTEWEGVPVQYHIGMGRPRAIDQS